MGSSGSKPAHNDALLLCKERIKHINQAIDSRYALSAAHLSYIQSLCRVGIALRQFAEATHLIESSSIGTSEVVDKSPSHSSCGSPSPSPSESGSPSSDHLFNMSYMRIAGASVMTVTIDSLATHFAEDECLAPSPREIGSSWDFFDPTGETVKRQLLDSESGQRISFGRRPVKQAEVVPLSEEEVMGLCEEEQSKENKACLEGFSKEFKSVNLTDKIVDDRNLNYGSPRVKGSLRTMIRIASSDISGEGIVNGEVQREILAEREDASEFITHRAKSFLSSMKEIEYRFLRAAETSNEISRLLETNKIRLGIYFEGRGAPTSSQITSVFNRVCCNKGRPFLNLEDSRQIITKAIAWHRSVSSLSSPARIPLISTAKDDGDNNGSGFSEEFCMISGSHSSTLDRLYAWECKLYDEIKCSEDIRKVYNQKCRQLRHQCARDLDAGSIDKTRAIVKDLHSRLGVAIQSVQSISKRIEKLRDDELQPQLVELMRGLIRMWKSMLECHHAQFITISLAYLTKSTTGTALGEPYRRALIHLRNEMSLFSHSFWNWINAYKIYVEALSTWLQKCILQPREYRKGRQVVFPPRQALSPPIFVLCKDWLLGLKSLPAKELCDCVEDVMSILHESLEEPTEDEQSGKVADERRSYNRGFERMKVQNCGRISNLDDLKAGLTRLFDRLTKFSEASLKVHEDVKQANEIASIAYATIVFY